MALLSTQKQITTSPMKKYKVIEREGDKFLEELSTMERPKPAMGNNFYKIGELKAYEQHLASLQTIPISKEYKDYWSVDEIVSENEFEIQQLTKLDGEKGAARVVPKNIIPRRIRLDLMKPAELSIYNAVQEVEKLGADVLLTEAVNLLQQARDKVSDHIDKTEGIKSTMPIPQKKTCTGKNCINPAIGDYNGYGAYACQYHMDKWNDYFDEYYR
jgi:hypothetical protein